MSPRAGGERRTPVPGTRIIRALSWLVPASRRREWVAEWTGELTHHARERAAAGESRLVTTLALEARCVGAVADAVWLRRHHGATGRLAQDVRQALRLTTRRPGFSAVVVLTLAIGIGATTAVFSVVNAVLLRSLPYPEPERLVLLRGVPVPGGDRSKVSTSSSYPDFRDIRATATAFSSLSALRTRLATLTAPDVPAEQLPITEVTADFFRTMGVAPARGRGFVADDARPGATPVAVLSDALWRGRFGGDPGIIGRTVAIDDVSYTVVGVAPPGFDFPRDTPLWRAFQPDSSAEHRGMHMLTVVGRLAPGVSPRAAEAQVRTIAAALRARYPVDDYARSARLEPLRDVIVGPVRTALLVLFGAVSLVLLICCANVANLFLARTAARQREIALRSALGASGGALLRQFVVESLVLAVAGGALGLLVAHGAVRALVAAAPRQIPRAAEIGVDGSTLAFAIGVSLLVGLVFGVAPVAWLARAPSRPALDDGARGTVGGGRGRRARPLLVVVEVALATVLVVGAGLLAASFRQLERVDPGFDPHHLLAVTLNLPARSYDSHAKVVDYYRQAAERVEAIPGVERAAIGYDHPLEPGWTSSFTIAGRAAPPAGQEPEARVRPVSPGYFRTVGVPLLAGRDISPQDVVGSPGVVVVNEAFARLHFPGQNPIGAHLLRQPWWPGMPSDFEIVGVVADERFLGPTTPPDPATYFALAQFEFGQAYLMVRTAGDPSASIPAIRRALRAIDPRIPLDQIRPMDDVLSSLVAAPRFNGALLGLFAVIALLLAALGIYGVLSHAVTLRSGEMGVRMALGATRARIVLLVVRQGMTLAATGLAIGLAGALIASRALRGLLFQVSPTDPPIFATVAVVLAISALVAAWLPAHRASRVDPAVALRSD